jgi:hypothetical protein
MRRKFAQSLGIIKKAQLKTVGLSMYGGAGGI